MQKIVLTFGLIAGAVLSAMMFLTIPFMDRIGFDKGAIIGYTSMVMAFLMVYFGIRSYRDNVAGGQVSFGRAFGIGMLISGIATICYVISWQIIFHFFVPDFAERYGAYAVEQARQAGASADSLAKVASDMAAFAESYKRPLVNIGFTFLEPLPVALVLTLVSAGLLSRKHRAEAVS
jgi:hypothetical protein